MAALLLCLPPTALAQKQWLPGHVPSVAAKLQPLGKLEDSKPLEVLIGLPLRHRETLTNLLDDLYKPGSPSFHQYLTPAQFTEQFGPTASDYESVVAFAKASGLVVKQTYGNRTLLKVAGSVADMEKTFHVHLRVYQHPTEKRTFYAPDSEPSVDLATPLLGITGLDDFVIPHPQNVRASRKNPAKPQTGSGTSGLYMGNDFRAAYVPGTSLTGTGQAVGLFELDDFYTSDVTTYEGEAQLPNVPLSRLTVDGYTSGSPGADNLEVALDIEMAVAMAPGLSSVIVYEGPNENNITAPNDVLNCMATNDAAKQLSCSWGFNINASTVSDFPTIRDPRPIVLSRFRRQRRFCRRGAAALGRPVCHRGGRDDFDHQRRGRRVGVGDGVELVQLRHGHQCEHRRHQHYLHHSFLAGAREHVSQPRLQRDAECPRRGADG